jgi:chemotaxis protein histidine kinase CheA
MSAKTPPNVRIFAVKTRFQELAQRPGGVPRDLAIQQAETGIEGYKADFVDWVDRELQELTRALRKVEGGQADKSQVDEIYRRCRQLRDTGTTMGLALLTFVADNLCRVLDLVQSGAPYDAEVIECHLDALHLAKQNAYRNIRPEQVPEMTSGLHRMLERASRSVPDKAG